MKLLDVLKKYDRCVLRESAKLTKIYKTILKESEELDDLEEATCPDCGNDPCTCESENEKDCDEAEETVMSAEEFFSEAEKNCDECGISESDEDVDESEDIEENDMLRNRPHNAHKDDPAGIKESDESDKDVDETEEMMSAEEFFSEAESDKDVDEAEEWVSATEFFGESGNDKEQTDESDKDVDETEEMMSAEEFFSEAESDKDVDEAEKEDVEESEKKDVEESEKEEKKLEESLKSYRRANHHLFID